VDLALQRGSTDNVTCLVVNLEEYLHQLADEPAAPGQHADTERSASPGAADPSPPLFARSPACMAGTHGEAAEEHVEAAGAADAAEEPCTTPFRIDGLAAGDAETEPPVAAADGGQGCSDSAIATQPNV
jgi:hypothetical protein